MIKCLFLGHKWKHIATHIGERISFNWFAKKTFKHDLTVEYYQCEKCGLWKKKTFIDHTLEDTEYLDEKPIEEQND